MSDAFSIYQDELQNLFRQIRESLDAEPPGPYTQNLLQQCEELLAQLQVEARTERKQEYKDICKSCKTEYQKLRQEADRQSLMSGSSYKNNNNSHSSRLQENEDMLGRQNDTLERARRTMEETESVALEITDELASNRETLMSAHGRVRQVSGLTGRARTVLSSMGRRATQQKMITYAVAIGLVIVFCILVWTMFR